MKSFKIELLAVQLIATEARIKLGIRSWGLRTWPIGTMWIRSLLNRWILISTMLNLQYFQYDTSLTNLISLVVIEQN